MNEWRDMSSAPHDGTVVEVMCTYGIAPWYALARWTSERLWVSCLQMESSWEIVAPIPQGALSGGYVEEGSLKWRPWNGAGLVKQTRMTHLHHADGTVEEKPWEIETVPSYVDPTGGRQNTDAYWLEHSRVPP